MTSKPSPSAASMGGGPTQRRRRKKFAPSQKYEAFTAVRPRRRRSGSCPTGSPPVMTRPGCRRSVTGSARHRSRECSTAGWWCCRSR